MIWTEELKSRVAEMWNAGDSGSAIAKKIGQGATRCMIVGAINRMMKRGDLRIIRTGRAGDGPWSDDDTHELLRLRETESLPFKAIARKVGRSPGSCANRYSLIIRELKESEA